MRVQNIGNQLPVRDNQQVQANNQPSFGALMSVTKGHSMLTFRTAKIKILGDYSPDMLVEINDALPHFNKVAQKYDLKIIFHSQRRFEGNSCGWPVEYRVSTRTNSFLDKLKRYKTHLFTAEPQYFTCTHIFGFNYHDVNFHKKGLTMDKQGFEKGLNITLDSIKTFQEEAEKNSTLTKFFNNSNYDSAVMRHVRDEKYGDPVDIFVESLNLPENAIERIYEDELLAGPKAVLKLTKSSKNKSEEV